MPLDKDEPLLRRKVAPRKPDVVATPADSGPAGGLARAFARVLSASTPLVAEDAVRHHKIASLPELLDVIEPDAFVIAMGQGGLAVIDLAGFSTLVEAMTVGRLSPRAPQPRRATLTDSALLAGLIDATLDALGPDEPRSAHRCTRPLPDHRLIATLLDEGRYDLVAVTARLACASVTRPLRMMLAFPVDPGPQVPVSPSTPATVWQAGFEAAVLGAPAVLRAELGRITLPLAEVLDLGIGATLTLPLSALEDVQIVGLDGQVQAAGRLGQSRGHRAVRLTRLPGTDAPPPVEGAS